MNLTHHDRQVNVRRPTSQRIDRFMRQKRALIVSAMLTRSSIRIMSQAISINRVCFTSKALQMFMPLVDAT